MNERFGEKRKGDRLSAEEVNRLQDSVERKSSTGSGDDGIDAGGFSARRANSPGQVEFFRMTVDSVDLEESRVNEEQGEFPVLNNAVRMVWDEAAGDLTDSPEGDVFLENPHALPYARGDIVAAANKGGRWVVIPLGNHRLAITARDPKGLAKDGVTVGWYPEAKDNPNVYCITFVNVPYPPHPGRWPVVAEYSSTGDVAIEPIATSPTPHATVLNFGRDYLPEGTLLSCFKVGERWFTAGGLGVAVPTPTTTTGPPGTTTTSTAPPACSGGCLWSLSGSSWVLSSSTCGSGCDCYYPDFCPGSCGTSATTNCYRGVPADHGNPPNCSGTTTTTTLPPGCVGTCTWDSSGPDGWVNTSNPCATYCPCPTPAKVFHPCPESTTTPCVPPPPPCQPYCTGTCDWVYVNNATAYWQVTRVGCTDGCGNTSCRCLPPQSAPTCGVTATTPCVGPPPTGTTTTLPPGSCAGRCYFCWTGSEWHFDRTDCVGCICPQPDYFGSAVGVVGVSSCMSPTTTTPPPTTTTTTTTATPTTTTVPPNYYCGVVTSGSFPCPAVGMKFCTTVSSDGIGGCGGGVSYSWHILSGPYVGLAACNAACPYGTSTTPAPTTTPVPTTTTTTTTTTTAAPGCVAHACNYTCIGSIWQHASGTSCAAPCTRCGGTIFTGSCSPNGVVITGVCS